jgi:Zn-dependent M28 family amino/carboxypeptidase
LGKTRTAVLAACAAMLVVAPAASAKTHGQDSPSDPRARHFVEHITIPRLTEHQRALQEIASANTDTRHTFTPGYAESVDYVTQTLRNAGYRPKTIPFNHPVWRETQPPVLNQVSPVAKTYRPGTEADDGSPNVDFITMSFSPTVSLTNAQIVPTNDIVIPPPAAGAGTSGCEATDFPAETAGKVALVMRGTCSFVAKAANAQAAGASGVIIFNDGFNADRQNPIFVDDFVELDIPAVITSFAVGKELYDADVAPGGDVRVDFATFGGLEDRFFPQVLAETRGGDPNNVVIVGAHLDSVMEGPGINDDGSGVALLLTMAEVVAEHGNDPKRKIRFMFFGGEEDGLIGSQYYAANLTDREVGKVDVMLDYDMLASPNYVRFVYDGDGSEPDNPEGPEGSGVVERVQNDWFRSKGLQTEPTPFDGRSDYVGFTNRGIPAGGIFAGAEVPKTAEQEAIYGGAAGSAYDPCYHEACDNIMTVLTGIPPVDAGGLILDDETPTEEEAKAAARKMRGGSLRGYREMGGGAAYATWYFSEARDPFGTKKPNGKPHKRFRNARAKFSRHRTR